MHDMSQTGLASSWSGAAQKLEILENRWDLREGEREERGEVEADWLTECNLLLRPAECNLLILSSLAVRTNDVLEMYTILKTT